MWEHTELFFVSPFPKMPKFNETLHLTINLKKMQRAEEHTKQYRGNATCEIQAVGSSIVQITYFFNK
jgi:hypothetical protein